MKEGDQISEKFRVDRVQATNSSKSKASEHKMRVHGNVTKPSNQSGDRSDREVKGQRRSGNQMNRCSSDVGELGAATNTTVQLAHVANTRSREWTDGQDWSSSDNNADVRLAHSAVGGSVTVEGSV